MGGRGRAEQHPCQGSRCLFRLRHLSCQLPFLWKPALLAPSPACTPANSRKPTFCSLRSCLDGDTTLGQAAMSPCPPLTGAMRSSGWVHTPIPALLSREGQDASLSQHFSPALGRFRGCLSSPNSPLFSPTPSLSPALFTSLKHLSRPNTVF